MPTATATAEVVPAAATALLARTFARNDRGDVAETRLTAMALVEDDPLSGSTAMRRIGRAWRTAPSHAPEETHR